MKKLILIAAVIYAGIAVNAQSKCDWAELDWGEQMKRPPGHFWGTQKFNEDLYLSVWRDGLELHIVSTTSHMNLIKQREIKIEHEARKGKYYYERIFRLGDKLCVMSKIKVKKDEKFIFDMVINHH